MTGTILLADFPVKTIPAALTHSTNDLATNDLAESQIPAEEETIDFFHGGRIRLLQPVKGFRAGMDSVLLASALAAAPGTRSLELGCGAGAALICAASRAPDARFTGLERDSQALARAHSNITLNGLANITLNGLEDRVEALAGDVAHLPPEFTGRFDQVFANPPFIENAGNLRLPSPARRASLVTEIPVALWIRAAARALAPKGILTLIHRADHVGALLAGLANGWGAVELVFVFARPDQPARRILLRARRDSRAAPKILPPLFLHIPAPSPDNSAMGKWIHSPEAVMIQAGGAFDWTRSPAPVPMPDPLP